MATAPKRKIVYSTTPTVGSRTKRGIMASSTFECGHGERTTATERKQGWTFCFDCFYGKPVDPMGECILREIGQWPPVKQGKDQ